MGAAASYVGSAVTAMLQMALFCAVGAAFAVVPKQAGGLLNPDALKSLSLQVYWLYTPALLLATFGAKLSVEVLRDTLGIMAWTLIHAGVNFFIGGWLFFKIYNVEQRFRATFKLAVTFNNGASVPLMVFAGLVRAPELISDTGAYDRAVVYIFSYVLLWNALFWSLGAMIMEKDAAPLGQAQAQTNAGGGGAARPGESPSAGALPAPSAVRDRDRVHEGAHGGGRTGGREAGRGDGRGDGREDGHGGESDGGYDLRELQDAGAMTQTPASTEEAGSDGAAFADGSASRQAETVRAPLFLHLRRGMSMFTHSHGHLETPQWLRFSPASTTALLKKALLTPATVGIVVGVLIGIWKDMRVALFTRGGALQPVGDVITLLGQPSIPVSNLILAGSLYLGARDFYTQHRELFERLLPFCRRKPAADAAATPPMTAVLLPTNAQVLQVPADVVRRMTTVRGAPDIAPGTSVMLVAFKQDGHEADAVHDKAPYFEERRHHRRAGSPSGMQRLGRSHFQVDPLHASADTIRRTVTYSEGIVEHLGHHHSLPRFRLPIAQSVQDVLHGVGAGDDFNFAAVDAHVHMDDSDGSVSHQTSRRTISGRARAISAALSTGAPVVISMDDSHSGASTGIKGHQGHANAASARALPTLVEVASNTDLEALALQAASAGPREHSPTELAPTKALPPPPSASTSAASDVLSVSWQTGVALIALRLVVCPICLFALFFVAESLRIPFIAPGRGAQDDVLRLVVLVESAVPSAQSVLLLCQTTGNLAAAKQLSLIFAVMYPLSLLTLTVALTAAMAMVF